MIFFFTSFVFPRKNFLLGPNYGKSLREMGHDVVITLQCGQGGIQMELFLNLNSFLGFGTDSDGHDLITTRCQVALYHKSDDVGSRRRVCLYPAGAAEAARNGAFEAYLRQHDHCASPEVLVDLGGLSGEQYIEFNCKFYSFKSLILKSISNCSNSTFQVAVTFVTFFDVSHTPIMPAPMPPPPTMTTAVLTMM